MVRHFGEPRLVNYTPEGVLFTVGVSERSSSGRLTATGEIGVTVPDGASLDEASLKAEALALAGAMLADNPELLTPVRHTDAGPHDPPARADGEKTPWSDGRSKWHTEKGAIGPSGILSPDTGQVDL